MGSDQRGRDLFSRIIYGGQVSLSVGLVGVAIMVFLGAIIGTVSGYFGGWVDIATQRFIETLRVFPEIPLWMALSAAIPATWPPEWVYAGIVVTATLAVPVTILGESALSFLGIGVRPPMISWGLLLSDAFRVQVIALYPWMLFPALFILITVLAFNFLGDGLRDMADPFS